MRTAGEDATSETHVPYYIITSTQKYKQISALKVTKFNLRHPDLKIFPGEMILDLITVEEAN